MKRMKRERERERGKTFEINSPRRTNRALNSDTFKEVIESTIKVSSALRRKEPYSSLFIISVICSSLSCATFCQEEKEGKEERGEKRKRGRKKKR